MTKWRIAASLPFFLWSRTRGLRRDGGDSAIYRSTDQDQALAHIAGSHIDALYYVARRPLSQTMAERVEALRDWAAERTVRAN